MRLTWQCSLGREWQIVRVQVAVGYNSMAGSSVSASFTRAREKPKYKLFKAKRCTSLSVLDSAFVSAASLLSSLFSQSYSLERFADSN